MAPKETKTDESSTAKDEVLVRVNPKLWQLDAVVEGEHRITHDKPVAVSTAEYRKLSERKTTHVDNDGEEHELQLVVIAD